MLKVKYDFPKIDLHLHLDGSISPELALELAKKEKINLPSYELSELEKIMMVPSECKDLTEYLKRFDLPLKVMQTENGLFQVTYELISRLASQGLVYAEIRFAPQLHTGKGLSQKDVVKTTVKAARKAMGDFPSITIGLILCAMRGDGDESRRFNLETIDAATEFLNKGVAAVDLAGAEGLFPTKNFTYLFEYARKLGVPYTIHSGEVGNTDSVFDAISFGTKRLGHGIATASLPELIKRVKDLGITLECCPTSNLHTKIVPSIQNHPIRYLFDSGVAVTVNTDNMTVSNTTLDKEYDILCEGLGFTRRELILMNINSVRAAFLPQSKKEELICQLQKYT